MRPSDEASFAEFVTGSSRALRRTAYLITGDWHRADDVLQSALVKLYVAWPRLTKSGAFPAYARKVVVNTAIDETRRPWRRESAQEDVGATNVDPVDHMVRIDNRLLVLAALAELAPRQRAAVVLRYYDELSVEETAEVLGVSTGTVKSQTARGLDALRVRLVAAGVTEPLTVGPEAATAAREDTR